MEHHDWQEFEELAARIYENLAPHGATVTHNDHIEGRDSGTARQIDVSIRFEVMGHEFLTIVQARDRSTPADVNSVGEFATVVEDVGAHKGVLISRSGFTDTAKSLAHSKGIDLCNVHDAASEKWTLDIRIPIMWIDLHPKVEFRGEAHFEEGDSVPSNLADWVLSSDEGQTRMLVMDTFERLWNARSLPMEPGRVHHLPGPDGSSLLTRTSTGQTVWRPIQFTLVYTVDRRAWVGTFSPDECIGLLHYEDGSFVGRFPVGAIPREPDAEWLEVDNPDDLALNIFGTLITTEGWEIQPGPIPTSSLTLRHAETGKEIFGDGGEA